MPTTTERRIVTVRYRATVYAEVDLDAGAVLSVSVDDESARLDGPAPVDVVDVAFDDYARPIAVEITPELAAEAVGIAERADWPEWVR